MKSLTGFDKCTKAIPQKNYSWRTPPDDCFCFETWSQYYYNKNADGLKLFWYKEVAGRWIEKNLLILYYLWKKQQTAKAKKRCWVRQLDQERQQKGEF